MLSLELCNCIVVVIHRGQYFGGVAVPRRGRITRKGRLHHVEGIDVAGARLGAGGLYPVGLTRTGQADRLT